MANKHVVVMGDLISSRKSGDALSVHKHFNAAVEHINKKWKKKILSPLTITLGDEFQGIVEGLVDAYKMVNELHELLKNAGLSCRFVIGTVQIATPLNSSKAWNMMGPGLAESREKLNQKSKESSILFKLESDYRDLESLLDVVSASLEMIQSGWKIRQKEYVVATLNNPDMSKEKIAQSLGVSKNAFYSGLRSAKFNYYEHGLGTIIEVLKNIDNEGLGRA